MSFSNVQHKQAHSCNQAEGDRDHKTAPYQVNRQFVFVQFLVPTLGGQLCQRRNQQQLVRTVSSCNGSVIEGNACIPLLVTQSVA